MNKLLITLSVLFAAATLQARCRTAVAVVVDSATYELTAPSVQRYADAIKQYDRKNVLILTALWTPERLRDTLMLLHRTKGLEGALLVGDIPVPMIRRSHHLCTAFKMNPGMPIKRSSVPSDRFYDCFSLRFDFISQDGLLYYYDLSPEGAQRVRCDIYTARIKPSKADPEHSFTELISEFLDKAASAKSSKDQLDEVFHFGGHGNSSESINARIDEERAYYEQFALKEPRGRVRFLNFDEDLFTRTRLMAALADPDVDFAHIHSHGAVGAQYISKEPYTYMTSEHINNVKSALRARMRRSKNKEATAAELCQSFDVPASWLEGWDDAEVSRADSLRAAAVDITLEDLNGYRSGAKVILLDACFNGAFLHDDYVASRYAFAHGSRTLAVTANSVNIIQDHWKNELAGLLISGTCVGEWVRNYMTLESHLFGDPTFSFAPSKTKSPDSLRGKAIHDGRYSAEKCLQILSDDPSMNVRLEAFYYIMREASDIKIIDAALRKGLDDPYEMLRRMAARYAENYGDPDMLEAIARHYLDPQEGARVRFHLLSAFSLYNAGSVEKALRSAWDGIWPTAADFESSVKRICNSIRSSDGDLQALAKGEGSEKDRALTISHQRNACIPAAIDPMFAVLGDEKAPEDLRLKAAEALGWYTHSFRRQEIYQRLNGIKVTPDALADEIHRTLRRLEDNAHTK
ncbi:MAG: HEAT repeat domain-containing protein [Bacteroidales bacterium]|nr:HEAT repeat domain-containing protein [Bacteroidales bacterium]